MFAIIPCQQVLSWEPQFICSTQVFVCLGGGGVITNPGTTPITILAVNSDHGLSFAGEETRTMVWVSFSRQIYSTFEFWRLKFSVVSFGLSFLVLWGWGWFPHRQGYACKLFSAAEKRGLWEGVVQEPLRRALFCVFCVLRWFSPANLTEISFRNCPSNAGIFWKTPSRKPPKLRSGPGKPNQRKASSWTFPGGIPEQKFNVNRACFPKEKHQNSQKWAKFMNFSFWPFLWFGLPVRLLKNADVSFSPKTIAAVTTVEFKIVTC